MASKWNFKYAFVIAAIAGFLAVSLGEALATPLLVHSSREDYFSGGTMVTGCTGDGCSSLNFNFGNPTGTSLWEVVEKVFLETPADNSFCLTPTCTEFTYTVFNDSLGSATPGSGIASFDVKSSGFSGLMSFPVSWTASDNGTNWHWMTSVAGFDIAPTHSLGCNIPALSTCFSVLLTGNIHVGFNTTFTDLGTLSHTKQTDPNWMVSAPTVVPEPASLMLLGSGLAGLGLWRRRHS